MFDARPTCIVVVGAQWGDEGKGKLVDVLAGKKATSGGSSETEVKEPTTMATGAPWSMAVTTQTPVG